MTSIALLMVGAALGGWAVEFLWRLKIREKADLGTRLECSGKLYNVVEDKRPTL